MLNRIILIGRLTQDPEMKYTNSGKAVATFNLAVDRDRKNANGEKETDFIRVVVWQKLAELVAQYLHKGRLASVEGRLQIRQYEDKEGRKVRVAEVIADGVQFLDKGSDNGNGSSNHASVPQQGGRSSQSSSMSYNDPFSDDGGTIDISDDDLPF
jgi:single-strand DNA-binding protein